MQQLFYYKMQQTFTTKCARFFYYKMRQLLQIATVLLENATVITKWDIYYKLRQYKFINESVSLIQLSK